MDAAVLLRAPRADRRRASAAVSEPGSEALHGLLVDVARERVEELRRGGVATRLTSGAGTETEAAISADGNTIAFTGEYDGNVDVFTMPVSGGVPKRA